MSETTLRTHPLIVIAATTVVLTCLLAIGIMLGLIPSPLARDRGAFTDNTAATAPTKRSALNAERAASRAAKTESRERATERAAVGGTSTAAGSGTAAEGDRPPKVAAVCAHCGTVTSVRTVAKQGEAGLLGPAAGGAVGGLVGSQIGGGSGKTIATIVGAAGGAAVGTELERRHKSTTHYVVGVRLNDGTTRSFTYGSAPGVREGDRVRVVDGRLVHDS
jgi:outer membrane lipoprotein SlyB